jgi:hypothetical protein
MCGLFPDLTALPELPAGTTVTINQTTDNPAVLAPQNRRQSASQPSRESSDDKHQARQILVFRQPP